MSTLRLFSCRMSHIRNTAEVFTIAHHLGRTLIHNQSCILLSSHIRYSQHKQQFHLVITQVYLFLSLFIIMVHECMKIRMHVSGIITRLCWEIFENIPVLIG